ncbi:hypothetical protein P9222_09030 [Paenibacillus amylolyticus]|nr:hypothetical protein [Paenibacillus amylolyticus]WFR64293.1 hypothetical protein P9222_09030 [Paenibacillus amylolyticus]
MKKTKILSGQTEILSSGTLITYDENPLKFIVELEAGFKLKVNMVFIDNDDSTDLDAEFDEEAEEINLFFYNFDSPFGTGNSKPIPIGTLDNKKLFFNFRLNSITESKSKIFQYTFYRNVKEGE